jgi:hypothetical protein
MFRLLKTLLVIFLLHMLPAQAGQAAQGQAARVDLAACAAMDGHADEAADSTVVSDVSAQDDLEPADPAYHIEQPGEHRHSLHARRLQTDPDVSAFSSHIPRGPDRPDWIRTA